jgi:methyl-accepting chemotaxis protein
MAHTVKGMEMISRNSLKVKEILSFLSEISDQLNMLSLNASIEAARSGVHGMGFSIVAGEMNKLADLTRSKTKEADTYISQMAGCVAEGKSMLTGSVKTFAGIKMQIGETNQRHKILLDKSSGYLEKINSINTLLEGLSQNASEIFEDIESRSLELGETYNAVNEINEGIGALQMESEKLSSTSLVMNSQSEKMKEAVMDFNPEPEETEKGLLN